MMVMKIDEIIVISSTNAYYTYMQSLHISSWHESFVKRHVRINLRMRLGGQDKPHDGIPPTLINTTRVNYATKQDNVVYPVSASCAQPANNR